MSCNNIYFDICLRKTMNYFSLSVCKFISGLLFSSRVERWKKFVSAGAKEEGNNIISCPFTALCMRCASHTRPARKRFVPFTLLASLRRNFTVFLRLRCWLLSLSYLVRCGSKCCGMRNLKLEPSVDLINLMIEFNRKMIHPYQESSVAFNEREAIMLATIVFFSTFLASFSEEFDPLKSFLLQLLKTATEMYPQRCAGLSSRFN